ncbi:MAG: TRAP transporter small permease subunit, partial [Betaproteobacteria bacterium]|nr:TRAP transporter small permease subunit [Betaproteobacteria bacterium]
MRKTLDSLYRLSGLLSAFFLLMIAVLVTAQIVGRLFDVLVPSADDFARLSMAASSFLGLAWALRRGAHIRVALLVEKFAPPRR